jgi:DNA (cytosine-5)-methyltransferase 1
MARAGLGEDWHCLFANDFDQMKAATYAANWGADHLVREDVGRLTARELPGKADLAWASFPCQDLSLAGSCAGLGQASAKEVTRSGAFWPFWGLMADLRGEGRAPRVIVLENVHGVLTSHGGRDFAAIGGALAQSNYRFGAMVIDAVRFVPQSRPRVFIVAVAEGTSLPAESTASAATQDWHPKALVGAYNRLSPMAKNNWIWWTLPTPLTRNTTLSDFIEEDPHDVRWHTAEQTARLLELMSPSNRAKVEAAKQTGGKVVGGVYKRTRPRADGRKTQRAEVRFDGVSGCLRTPAGGSSRQTLVVCEDGRVRSRLLSSREAARLMGLPDSYKLPERYNDAYRVAGDGVCPQAVRHLARHLLEPILAGQGAPLTAIAAE